MKKLLLTLTAVAGLTFVTKAQEFDFQKEDFIVEGAIGVHTTDDKNTSVKTSDFIFAPKFGYFVSDKVAVGLGLSIGQEKETDYSGEKDTYTKGNTFGIGAFARYYFLEVGSRFKVYGEAGAGYANVGGEEDDGTDVTKTDKINSFGVNAGIGANFFLTQNIAIGYQFADVIGFNSSKIDAEGAKANNAFHANLNSFDNFFNSGKFSLTFKF